MKSHASAHRSWRKNFAWVMLVCICLNNCSSVIAPMLPSLGPPTEDEETKISREFRREAKKHLKFVNSPEIERFVDRIGRRILSAAGPQVFDYRFFVVDDDQLNAFAVPGGSVYLFSGLIERAKTTDELAGVLGHEIVHIKGRHMARNSGPDAISVLSLLSMVLLARSGSGAQAAGMVGQGIAAARQASYSRGLEMESDTLGARYMAAAGYDPKGVIGFLKTLDQERALNPIEVPAYVMSHPVTQERVANAELVVKSLGATNIRPDDLDTLKKVQIIIRMERANRDTVVSDYAKQVQQHPADPELLHLLAFAQQLKGDLPAAKRNYEQARKLNPNHPGRQRDLGRFYTQTEDYPAARAAYDQALVLEPNEPLTYFYMGEMLEKSGDLRSAAGAYLNANNLAPLWYRPPQRLGFVYSKLDRLGDGYYYLGRSYLLQDEDERAITEFERALKISGTTTPRGQVIAEELKVLKNRKK